MKQPKFQLWPWGAMALAVPAFAGSAGVIFAVKDPRSGFPMEKFWDAAVVFFSVLGAGNGYLIGIAVGDLGRSLFALVAGAAAGLVSVHALQEPLIGVIYIFFLMILMANSILNASQVITGCTTVVVLAFVLMFSLVSHLDHPELHLCVCYPLVCSCNTASLPLEWTTAAMFGAALSGTRAALHGMMYGLVVFAFSCILGGDERIFVLGCISGAVVANYFCIKALFGSVYRVEHPVAPQPQQEGPEAEQPPAHS
jgi:hypothetical protein